MPQLDQPVPAMAPPHRSDPASMRQEYSTSLREEAEEYEAANRNLERAIEDAETELSRRDPVTLGLPREMADCAALEIRLVQLEAELSDLADDALPLNDPMLRVSDLTAMEVACWQIDDTVEQLRAAEARENERLAGEKNKLDDANVLLDEAQILNRALSAKAQDDVPSARVITRRTQARMTHLQDHYRIVQAGLVDYIDHLSTSLAHAGEEGERPYSFQHEDLSLRAYFGRPPRDTNDTPERRAAALKSLLEELMNEALLDLASQSGSNESLRNLNTKDLAQPDDQSEYLLRVLERIGLVEHVEDRWRLVVSTDVQ